MLHKSESLIWAISRSHVRSGPIFIYPDEDYSLSNIRNIGHGENDKTSFMVKKLEMNCEFISVRNYTTKS